MDKSTEFDSNAPSVENNAELSNLICLASSNSRRSKRLNRRLNQAYWMGSRFKALADIFEKKAA
ncbi:MAG: hypothetical protein MUD14_27655 [Hydrococcus sp. Prado102]|jgi:hypothetical protein|nr:hypothetical protein [Hydrococcus sp. Prado102]